jgi:hypothetical protein
MASNQKRAPDAIVESAAFGDRIAKINPETRYSSLINAVVSIGRCNTI